MKHLPETIIILILAIATMETACAQRFEEVVYLSNGSIVRGTVLPDSTSGKVRILNHSGDIWAFSRAEVDSIKHEKPFEYKASMFNRKGFEMNVNAEFLARSGSNAIGKAVIPGVTIGAGYRLNPWFSAGAGAGIEFYDFMEVPLSATLRLRSSSHALSPFLILRGGYTLPAEKRPNDWEYSYKGKGGTHFTIGTGIEKIINENSSFLLSFAYHYQEINYHLSPLNQWTQERNRSEVYSRFRLALGYVFK